MSDPLRDMRAKITTEADAVLDAMHRATGLDKSEIVRNVLHDWATSKINEASLVRHCLQAEGLVALSERIAGKTTK